MKATCFCGWANENPMWVRDEAAEHADARSHGVDLFHGDDFIETIVPTFQKD